MNDNIQVTSPSLPPLEEFIEEIREIWETHRLTNNGPKHNLLAQRLCDYLGVPRLSLFANGHLALEAALEALGLQGEVITTPFTYASTTHAIVRRGLTPRFCDIDEETFNLNPDGIEALITGRTSAILPVHVYGTPCDTEKIEEIARRHGLPVIYDAAHAFGVRVGGRGIGSCGDISMFSFHATKVFNTFEGGGLAFADEKLEAQLLQIKQFGAVGQDDAVVAGTNAKMTEISAAMGLCNLRHTDEQIGKRERIARRYLGWLDGVPGIRMVRPRPDVRQNYAYFPVVFDGFRKGRDEICESLQQNGIYPRKYFYPLTSKFVCYKGRLDPGSTPVAEHIADRVLTLPMYADLPLEAVDTICKIILE